MKFSKAWNPNKKRKPVQRIKNGQVVQANGDILEIKDGRVVKMLNIKTGEIIFFDRVEEE